MDTTKAITHVSLCAGYGGIDIGLKRAIPNLRTIAFSEIETFACANLVSKMEAGLLDAAPIWTDLKTFPWSEFRDRVDILSGGYPCQPFSAAGKRQGADDPRHLWPYIADGIVRMQPRVCFFENVEGHITLGLRDVLHDLAGMGYRTTWGIFSASEVGAPHQRKRVFILADKQREGLERPARKSIQGDFCGLAFNGRNEWPSRPGEPQHAWEPPRVVADAKKSGQREWKKDLRCPQSDRPSEAMGNSLLHGHPSSEITGGSGAGEGEGRVQELAGGSGAVGNAASEGPQERSPRGVDSPIQAAECGSGGEGSGETKSSLGGNLDGFAGGLDYAELCVSCDNRTDELRLLGNGVVPATAERAFKILTKELYND